MVVVVVDEKKKKMKKNYEVKWTKIALLILVDKSISSRR